MQFLECQIPLPIAQVFVWLLSTSLSTAEILELRYFASS